MVLRVTLEIMPFGEEDKKRQISRFDIFNKGPAEFGHYRYGVIEINENEAGLWSKEVLHRRDLGAEELVRKVLEHRNKMKD
jgi:hypothetical protein